MKGVMRFGKRGKLSPRYKGPSKIFKSVYKVVYELELPAELAALHPIFHISILKKCVGDPKSLVPLDSVVVKDSISYENVSVVVLDRQVRRLRNNEVVSLKVLWKSQSIKGASWEEESSLKSKYSHLFHSDYTPALENSYSLVFQSFMHEFCLRIMFPCLYLHFKCICMLSELN